MSKSSSAKYFIDNVLKNNRSILSQAITLSESSKNEHRKLSEKIIEKCYPHSGNSLRIGITGAPGVGKSTFIEALGNYLLNKGKKIAVLAIDPSSKKNRGSILGDKTRMEKLSANENVFIRPSPTSGELGGTGIATREAIILCEAAGYEIIFIETVGVGQSEIDVRYMVDCFLLLTVAGTGDELQGIKRGIMEMADLVLINKSDNEFLKSQISNLKSQISNALHLFPANENGWKPKVFTCSSLTNAGIEEIWKNISEYFALVKQNNFFKKNRNEQIRFWFRESLERQLKNIFFENKSVKKILQKTERELLNGKLNPNIAAKNIFKNFKL